MHTVPPRLSLQTELHMLYQEWPHHGQVACTCNRKEARKQGGVSLVQSGARPDEL
jgi:hypothetical protein